LGYRLQEFEFIIKKNGYDGSGTSCGWTTVEISETSYAFGLCKYYNAKPENDDKELD